MDDGFHILSPRNHLSLCVFRGKTDDETTTWTTDGGGVDGGDEWVWWG